MKNFPASRPQHAGPEGIICGVWIPVLLAGPVPALGRDADELPLG